MRALGALVFTILAVVALPATGRSAAVGKPDVAALQVALRAADAYAGPVDGWRGPKRTRRSSRSRRAAGLEPDGIVGPRARGWRSGRSGKASSARARLAVGSHGWDVAGAQFRLAWHGFPSGRSTARTGRGSRRPCRFQRFASLLMVGIAGRGRSQRSAVRAPDRPT